MNTLRTSGLATLIALVTSLSVAPRADHALAAPALSSHPHRHHYTIDARVRPLLFWIGKNDVGDAVLAKTQDANAVGYALLIGSDPDRAPRRINRWGYISEEIRGGEATLVGLMTESDEESVSEAEASLRKRSGERTFNVIRGSIGGGEARSVVTSIAAPSDYTFRQVDAVLDLADSRGRDGKTRVVRLPDGTRPGFLAAAADVVHRHAAEWQTTGHVTPGGPTTYVYHGKLYELRATRSREVANVRVGGATYEHAIASQFEVKSLRDGELTNFSMTYAADGAAAETLLTATYQPRWWIEIQLTLDDTKTAMSTAPGTRP